VVAKSMGRVTSISGTEFLGAHPAAGAENCHAGQEKGPGYYTDFCDL
jgi:hypothetical protein